MENTLCFDEFSQFVLYKVYSVSKYVLRRIFTKPKLFQACYYTLAVFVLVCCILFSWPGGKLII